MIHFGFEKEVGHERNGDVLDENRVEAVRYVNQWSKAYDVGFVFVEGSLRVTAIFDTDLTLEGLMIGVGLLHTPRKLADILADVVRTYGLDDPADACGKEYDEDDYEDLGELDDLDPVEC